MLCSHAVSRQGSPTAWLCGHCCQVACEVGIVVVVGRDDAKGPAMSALRPEADIWARLHHVCFGPIGDILLEVSTRFDLYLRDSLGGVMSAQQYSRRKAVSSLAATVACAFAGPIPVTAEPVSPVETQNCAGPIFSTTGPNAELYGAKDGYPLPDIAEARRQGDPWEPKYRVGAFTHIDHIYPTRLIRRPVTPWAFKCSRADVYYNFQEIGRAHV